MRNFILSLVFLFILGFQGFSQTPCSPGQRFCRDACRDARECRGIGPPPPGLVVPIDKNIYLLVFAGLGLGIYSISAHKRKFSA